jgi:hypothetical protein
MIEGIMIGYDNRSKAYCCYIPASKKIAILRDMKFDEGDSHLSISLPELQREEMPSFTTIETNHGSDTEEEPIETNKDYTSILAPENTVNTEFTNLP